MEVLRGLQHVAVVRVDLLEAMLFGAGEVEGVTRSDEASAIPRESRRTAIATIDRVVPRRFGRNRGLCPIVI